jgi:hypothetical protein
MARENFMPLSDTNQMEPDIWEFAQEDRRQKRKARLRLARRVALATVCLLAGVCVYSVLMPAPVSAANGFFGGVMVWAGNLLKPNNTMDAPPPSDFENSIVDIPVQKADCKTIEEVHAAYGLTVYEPTQIPESMKLGKVQANLTDGDLIDFSYRYAADDKNMVLFSIAPKPDSMNLTYPEDAIAHSAPVGDFTVWKTKSGWWSAMSLTDDSLLNIKGTLDKDAFLTMLNTLRPVS